jgi:hypothetical protein
VRTTEEDIRFTTTTTIHGVNNTIALPLLLLFILFLLLL